MATTNKPDPSFSLDSYDLHFPMWELIEDCLRGQEAIKYKKDTYLPKPNATDVSAENKMRYEQYLLRAVFYNFTQRTLNGLTGQVFQKDPQVEMPTTLAIMEEDIDGSGVTLVQQSQRALASVVSKGRSGLLVDFPVTGEAITQKDLKDGKIHPVIVRLDPEQIINWRTVRVGSKTVLSLVVLKETATVSDDGFEEVKKDQWRELKMENGAYVVNLWQLDDNTQEYEIVETLKPTDQSGNALTFIPFVFIGSVNNDPEIDQPPMFDMAVLNVAHYRNSADYEEACYILGQPTPWFAGLTASWVEDILKGQVQLGARAAVPLPEGASAGLLQVEPNTMPKEAMDTKERQAVALGAKLVETKTVQRSATEASMDNASDTSILGQAANNVSAAYVKALEFASVFVGIEEEPVVQLNTDFASLKMSAQERTELLKEWQSGAITDEEMRTKLTDSGVAFQPLDEWQVFKEENAQAQMMLLGAALEGSTEDDNEDEENGEA